MNVQLKSNKQTRKTQDDRLLKQLPFGERRKQEQMRRLIMAEQPFASV